MKPIGGIDALVRASYAQHGKALDAVDSRGRVYDAKCGRERPKACPGTKRHWKETTERWVCAICGSEWPFDDVMVLKGWVQRSPRPGEYEDRLVALVDVGYALTQMLRPRTPEGELNPWRWVTQMLVGYAITIATLEDIAEHARTYAWPSRTGKAWTEAMVRDAVRKARQELSRRLRTSPCELPEEVEPMAHIPTGRTQLMQ